MSRETELLERVARIEQQLKDSKTQEDVRAINEKLDRIDRELSRYRGFVGGILLVVTAVVSFFKFFWEDLVRLFYK